MYSIKESLEASAWALNCSYGVYVATHALEFESPPMDKQTYEEFVEFMERWYKKETGE